MDSTNQTNINNLWLNNIFENIKNIEIYERMARNGCKDLIEFIQCPPELRDEEMSEVQFQNLLHYGNEILVMLPDFASHIDEELGNQYINRVKIIIEDMRTHKGKYIRKIISDPQRRTIKVKPTENFYITLDIFYSMRRQLILKIEPFLFTQEQFRPGDLDKNKTVSIL